MLPPPRIIAIDDDATHLAGLSQALNHYGVACLPVHFTGDDEAVQRCPYVRVIFADLHLNESGPSNEHARNFAIIGGLLEEAIAPTGPYAIVLWTRFADQADDLAAFLNERLRDVPRPFTVVAIDKGTHLDESGKVIDPVKLVVAINDLVQAEPQIAALLDWEQRVLGAGAETVSAIIHLAEPNASKEERQEKLRRVLCQLAVGAVGEHNVGDHHFDAVNEALLPILADRIAFLKEPGDTGQLWASSFSVNSDNQGLDAGQASKLNRFLHIGSGDGIMAGERGAVVALSQVVGDRDFETVFGLKSPEVADQFFCSNFDETNQLFKWVAVQVQAPCDFAQRRPGPLPFLLGLEMPVGSVSKNPPPAALVSCPVFETDDGPVCLRLHSRFGLSLPEKLVWSLPAAYRLREQLLADVLHRAHSYAARPGIISFKS